MRYWSFGMRENRKCTLDCVKVKLSLMILHLEYTHGEGGEVTFHADTVSQDKCLLISHVEKPALNKTALTFISFSKCLLWSTERFLLKAFLEPRNKVKGYMTLVSLHLYLHSSCSQLPFSRILCKGLELSFVSTSATISTNICL